MAGRHRAGEPVCEHFPRELLDAVTQHVKEHIMGDLSKLSNVINRVVDQHGSDQSRIAAAEQAVGDDQASVDALTSKLESILAPVAEDVAPDAPDAPSDNPEQIA